MGRPRKWKTDAERKAAERRKKKAEAARADEGEVEVVRVEPPIEINAQPPPVAEGLEEFVQTNVVNPATDYTKADELGRRYGENEADRRGERGQKRADRIQRAIDYQRWLVDHGNPPA